MARAFTASVGALTLALASSASAYADPDRDEFAAFVPRDIPVRSIDPAALPRGDDAAINHLQDGVIHTPEGRTLRVEVPYEDERQALLGRSGGDWLVASWRADVAQVNRIRRGETPAVVPKTRIEYAYNELYGWRASRDGAWLLTTNYNRGGSMMDVREVATGRWVEGTMTGHFFTPEDAGDGHVITYQEGGTSLTLIDMVPPDERHVVAPDGVWASIIDNLIFVGSRGRYGPTLLDHPGMPRWNADFVPLDVSPNGRLLVGLGARMDADSPVLELRRLADGKVLQAISLPPGTREGGIVVNGNEQTVRFEDDRRFVFQSNASSSAVLVRCRLSGRCDRASEYGGNISTPFESFMW